MSKHDPFLDRMISILLREMITEGIKRAQIRKNEKATIVLYQKNDRWEIVHQQALSYHLPILQELKRLAKIDPHDSGTMHRGHIVIAVENIKHQFLLRFPVSEQDGPMVDISY